MDRYVYMLMDGDIPFYVGKGTHRGEYANKFRRPIEHYQEAAGPVDKQKNRLKCAVINKIIAEGRDVDVTIVADNLSELAAIELETSLIRQHKRLCDGGVLTNLITEQREIAHETRCKPVYAFRTDGTLFCSFTSIKEAAAITKCKTSIIVSCCKGKYKTAGGFVWAYTNEFPGYSMPIPWNRKPICCYTPDGTLVAEYESATSAEQLTGISQSAISSCIRNESVTAGGFCWFYADAPFVQRISKSGNTPVSVSQYTVTNQILNTFASITEAAKTIGISIASISQCCVGRSQTAGGYKWKNNKNDNI